MKPPAGTFFGVLLLCAVLPWVSGDVTQASTKDGACPLPPSIPNCSELGDKPMDECATDQQCRGEEKCCTYGCRQQCKEPVRGTPATECVTTRRLMEEKAGYCPAVDRAACKDVTPAPAECQRDSQCPGSERCCCRNCTQACTETVTAHRGSCPKSIGHIGMVCAKETVECSDDSNCTADQKCCHAPVCITKCVKAVAENPGYCPIDPHLENTCEPLAPPRCSSDAECAANEKCCLFGCGMQCVKALPDTGHRGLCPKIPGHTDIQCIKENIQCTYDSNCTADEKCCSAPVCTTKCVKAVAAHVGFCPSPQPVTCTGEPILDCTQDSVCAADQKCCVVGCRKKCVKSVKGKPGACRTKPGKDTAVDKCNKCNEDKDCPRDEKCCSGDQGRECQKPTFSRIIVRPGDCPLPYELCTDPPLYDHTCNHDGDCPKGNKCCVRSCSRQCYPAVPVVAKPGTCPVPYIKCYENKDECNDDSDCLGSKKCCYVHCGMQCAEPITVHIGVCPNVDACSWAYEFCDSENDCWGYQRCCKFPCGGVCVLPVPEKTSP